MAYDSSEDNEILISIPYNENNILIESEDVERLLSNFGIKIKVNNIEIFREAMSHYSYVNQKYYSKFAREMNEMKKNRNYFCATRCVQIFETISLGPEP